ncbi:hypothetical protein CDL12_12935 [Handroanthus impetiginosus]|uniref:Uncharacterized protein n=1 Tax=Handroanthus impetiginosus TaxID=429701 RepID=A0A2G9HA90_9LAMI|nr:hypothetical protein CDL12_12935 [Handroanthus impetiginosus]
MEEDKKKKKNRKKKNKQTTKQTESVTLDARESTSDSQSHVSEMEHTKNGQAPGIIDEPNDVGGHIHVDRDSHLANGAEGTDLATAEKQHWVATEASYQEKIKELQAEKDAKIQKEAFLEERIKQLLKERDENSQKEASQEGKIKQLCDEKNDSMQNEASLRGKLTQLEKEKEALIQNEGSLQQKIQQLQREINAHLQQEASLDTEILQLKGEKKSWVQKEAGLEQKISQLVDEAALLNLNGVSLQEKIKQMERERDFWILKENTARESIASLTSDNTKLRAQVIELEQSRQSFLEESRQLRETVSSMQLQINNLEGAAGFSHSSLDNKVTSECGDVNCQIEAARTLVEKLIAENSELVEKVNELYAELDRRGGMRIENSFSASSVPVPVTSQSTDTADGPLLIPDLAFGADDRHRPAQATDPISEGSKMLPISGSTQSLEDIIVKDQRNSDHVNDDPGLANSSEKVEADEIVQIPLGENEVKDINVEVTQNDEKTDVPLTDAPLIGAPFRLISFVARYVSGADLVNKNTGKSGY